MIQAANDGAANGSSGGNGNGGNGHGDNGGHNGNGHDGHGQNCVCHGIGGNGNGNGHNGHTTLGERLAFLRREADLSQSLLAERSGLSQQMLSRLENGGKIQRVPMAILRAVAEGLSLDLHDLVKGTSLDKHVEDEADEDPGVHLCYCPNVFCGLNNIQQYRLGGYELAWSSVQTMTAREWRELEFCGHCGTRLVKACPHCSKRIRKAPEFFCSRCGKQIDEGPHEHQRKYLDTECDGRCRHYLPPLMKKQAPAGALLQQESRQKSRLRRRRPPPYPKCRVPPPTVKKWPRRLRVQPICRKSPQRRKQLKKLRRTPPQPSKKRESPYRRPRRQQNPACPNRVR